MLVVGSDESEPAKARAAVACPPSRLRVVDVGTASAVLMIGGRDESVPTKASGCAAWSMCASDCRCRHGFSRAGGPRETGVCYRYNMARSAAFE